MRGPRVLSLLHDMLALSEANPDVYCDFELGCRDGGIRVPRVLIQILCQDSYILSAIADIQEAAEPCLLSLPSASVSDVRKALRLFFANHHELEEVTFAEVPKSLYDSLPWINWDRWLSSVKFRPASGQPPPPPQPEPPQKRKKQPKEQQQQAPKKSRAQPKPRQCSICGKKLCDR